MVALALQRESVNPDTTPSQYSSRFLKEKSDIFGKSSGVLALSRVELEKAKTDTNTHREEPKSIILPDKMSDFSFLNGRKLGDIYQVRKFQVCAASQSSFQNGKHWKTKCEY